MKPTLLGGPILFPREEQELSILSDLILFHSSRICNTTRNSHSIVAVIEDNSIEKTLCENPFMSRILPTSCSQNGYLITRMVLM